MASQILEMKRRERQAGIGDMIHHPRHSTFYMQLIIVTITIINIATVA